MTGQTQVSDFVQPDEPTLGRIVIYRDDIGRDLVGIVTGTQDSCTSGEVPESRLHVHLAVFSPGGQSTNGHYSVPHSFDGAPRTWRWPTRA